MSEAANKLYVSTRALNRSTGKWESIRGEAVLSADYDRLEQECERLRGQIAAALSVFPMCVDRQKFSFNGQQITADGNDCFYGVRQVDSFLNEVYAALSAKP